jgi:transcriptional regulator with XRE-family HTH domain
MEEAAESVDVSAKFLGEFERGVKHPSFQTIINLAVAYKVNPSVFFKGTEPQTDKQWRNLIGANLDECSTERLQTLYRVLLAVRLFT